MSDAMTIDHMFAADLGDGQVPGPGAGDDVRGPGERQAVPDVDRDVGVRLQLAVVLAHVLGQEAPDDQVAILAHLQPRVLPDLEAAGEDDAGPALPEPDEGAEPEHGAGEAHRVPGRREVSRADRENHRAPGLISGKYEVREQILALHFLLGRVLRLLLSSHLAHILVCQRDFDGKKLRLLENNCLISC